MLKSIWNHSDGRTVIGNYTALLFIQGVNFILPLITLPYLVRTLGSEKYGLVMIAQSMAVFLTVIVDFGFNISATREVSLLRKDKKKLSQLFWNVFFVKLLLVVVTFCIVLFLINAVERFKVESWVYLLSFGMVLGQAIFPAWFFQGIERMKVITVVNVIAKLLFTVAIFIFVLQPKDYEYVPLLNSGGFIAAGLAGFLYSLKYVAFSTPKISQIKLLVKQTSSLFVSNFATSLYTAGNTFILGMIGGDAIAGVYASMEKLVLAVKNIYVPLYQAIFPWLATKGSNAIRSFIKKISTPIAISGLVIVMAFVVFAKPILHFVYDDVIIESYSVVLQILSGIALFSAVNMLLVSLFYPAMMAYKKRMFILVSGGVFSLLLALLGATYFNIYGVAVAAVSTELFIAILAIYYFKLTPNTKAV